MSEARPTFATASPASKSASCTAFKCRFARCGRITFCSVGNAQLVMGVALGQLREHPHLRAVASPGVAPLRLQLTVRIA